MERASRSLWLAATLLVATGLVPASASAAEVCDGQVCVSGAEWSAGEQLDDKARAKERKRNRKGKDSTLTVELVGARGSVFVDGVWIATAPIDFVPIKPGKHDLEVRDGERLVARGVLDGRQAARRRDRARRRVAQWGSPPVSGRMLWLRTRIDCHRGRGLAASGHAAQAHDLLGLHQDRGAAVAAVWDRRGRRQSSPTTR